MDFKLKRGDTFLLMANIPTALADGYFVGFAVTCQIRKPNGDFIADVVCSWSDATVTRVLQLKVADTTLWPSGTAEFDVQFMRTSDGYTVSSSTQSFAIIRDVTRS
jgi:hypothetical protein